MTRKRSSGIYVLAHTLPLKQIRGNKLYLRIEQRSTTPSLQACVQWKKLGDMDDFSSSRKGGPIFFSVFFLATTVYFTPNTRVRTSFIVHGGEMSRSSVYKHVHLLTLLAAVAVVVVWLTCALKQNGIFRTSFCGAEVPGGDTLGLGHAGHHDVWKWWN